MRRLRSRSREFVALGLCLSTQIGVRKFQRVFGGWKGPVGSIDVKSDSTGMRRARSRRFLRLRE